MTQIIVPIMLETAESKLDLSLYQSADLIEWRVDFAQMSEIEKIAANVQNIFKQPLVFTIRTTKEGGNYQLTSAEYLTLLEKLINFKPAYLDFEFFSYPEIFPKIQALSQKNQVKLVLSYHNFSQTPADLEKRLCQMLAVEPAVAKFAVMPAHFSDVLEVLRLTSFYANQTSTKIVTMAMGELGKLSRVTGNLSGSAWTFASAEKSSAPGQLTIEQTKKLLNEFS